jgi:hypothetical protein
LREASDRRGRAPLRRPTYPSLGPPFALAFVEGRLQTIFARLQLLFSLLALADVADDLRGTDDAAFRGSMGEIVTDVSKVRPFLARPTVSKCWMPSLRVKWARIISSSACQSAGTRWTARSSRWPNSRTCARLPRSSSTRTVERFAMCLRLLSVLPLQCRFLGMWTTSSLSSLPSESDPRPYLGNKSGLSQMSHPLKKNNKRITITTGG